MLTATARYRGIQRARREPVHLSAGCQPRRQLHSDDLAVIRPRREVIRVGRCELRTASGQTGLGLGHVPGVVPSLESIIERLRRRYAEIGHGGSPCSEDKPGRRFKYLLVDHVLSGYVPQPGRSKVEGGLTIRECADHARPPSDLAQDGKR